MRLDQITVLMPKLLSLQNGQVTPADLALVQDQLRDVSPVFDLLCVSACLFVIKVHTFLLFER